MKEYYIYILSNQYHTVFYVGVTNNLEKRFFEHKSGKFSGFCSQYNCKKLLYYEETNDVYAAIEREKQLKGWRREKKIKLILLKNPDFIDLSCDWEN